MHFKVIEKDGRFVIRYKQKLVWAYLKHGQFWASVPDSLDGHIMHFNTKKAAVAWLINTFSGIFILHIES